MRIPVRLLTRFVVVSPGQILRMVRVSDKILQLTVGGELFERVSAAISLNEMP
jgi:hypothetical protein